ARVVIHHIQTPETIWVRAAKSRAEGRRAHRSGGSPRTWSGRRKGRSYTISVGSWLEGITTEVRLRQQPRAPVIKRKGNVALSRLTACVRERQEGEAGTDQQQAYIHWFRMAEAVKRNGYISNLALQAAHVDLRL